MGSGGQRCGEVGWGGVGWGRGVCVCVCVCVCVAKPVAVELRCHATALIEGSNIAECPSFEIGCSLSLYMICLFVTSFPILV